MISSKISRHESGFSSFRQLFVKNKILWCLGIKFSPNCVIVMCIQKLVLSCAETLWQYTIPSFLGMARSVGRIPTAANSSLLGSLFPRPPSGPSTDACFVRTPSVVRTSQVISQRRTFNTFRSIIPRTMSQTILSSTSPSPPPTVDLAANIPGQQRSPSPIDSGIAIVEPVTNNDHPEPSRQFLNKIGASFPQVVSGSENAVLQFTDMQLDELLTSVSWLAIPAINVQFITPVDRITNKQTNNRKS